MGESVLLLVRFLILGLFDRDHFVLRNSHRDDLFSIVRWRLSLVVAIICCIGRLCNLCFHLFNILLHNWGLFIFSLCFTTVNLLFTSFLILNLKLEITEFIPTLLFFGYSSLISLTLWILTGTIGFFSSYIFVSKIYAAVKID